MKGIGVVGGMAYAPLKTIRETEVRVERRALSGAENELQRFERAKRAASEQLESLMRTADARGNAESAGIFDYQLLMLEDEGFMEEIAGMVRGQGASAEYAVKEAGESVKKQLALLDNEYLRDRAADVDDLVRRLMFALAGTTPFDASEITSGCIVAARDLPPSLVAGFDPSLVKGILLERGSATSHCAIIARSLGIPCIIGAAGLMAAADDGKPAFMNADMGEIAFAPTENQQYAYEAYENRIATERSALSEYIDSKAVTKDGHAVGIYANIASAVEAGAAIRNGCDGVGLFRTEFLFMESATPPGYETQLRAYSQAAKALGGRPLVIRTLDAGGDKHIPYLDIGAEDNPFLGLRAIRYCLSDRALFSTQLSAILAAAASQPGVELMLPMVTTLSELRQAKALIGEARCSVFDRNEINPQPVKVGMMVETPVAAIDAERFAGEVDFFSIGTNDLTQYLFAADRGNAKVAYLNNCFHPCLLRLIQHICLCAKKHGIAVDICGHAGEVPQLVPIWVAMGVDNLSVGIPSILKTKRIVCGLEKASLAPVLNEILSMDEASDVERFLKDKFSENVHKLG